MGNTEMLLWRSDIVSEITDLASLKITRSATEDTSEAIEILARTDKLRSFVRQLVQLCLEVYHLENEWPAERALQDAWDSWSGRLGTRGSHWYSPIVMAYSSGVVPLAAREVIAAARTLMHFAEGRFEVDDLRRPHHGDYMEPRKVLGD